MYFFKNLRHEVLLSPECFGPKLKDVIRRKLIDEVEGDRGPAPAHHPRAPILRTGPPSSTYDSNKTP